MTIRGKLFGLIILLTLSFGVTVSVSAFDGAGNPDPYAGEDVKDPCPGKCINDAGGGTCPAGYNKVQNISSAGFNCPDGQTCCSGSGVEGLITCSSTQSLPKPGFNAVRCGTNQCRPNGQYFYTDCMTTADCASNSGTDDGGNEAGCTGGLKCCRIKKDACKPIGAPDNPNVIRRCTTLDQCKGATGKVLNKDEKSNEHGCGKDYPICCELQDSADRPMPNIGEPVHGVGSDSGSVSGSAGTSALRRLRKYQNINAFCFTEMECSSASYPGAWVKGNGCPNRGNTPQGYCKAADPDYNLQYPIAGVKTIKGLRNFMSLIFNYGISLLMIAAALMFVYGGLRYIFSAVANDIEVAKTVMIDSVVGLGLGLAAYVILANVNFNTLSLRSFDVFMINKLSFFDTLYCSDVKPASGKSAAMFQDAGTPIAPENLNITKGYTIDLKGTKCGREYFVEGGDSLSICSGSGCAKGACLTCAGGSKNCQTSSEKEFHCSDADIAGNLVLAGKMNPMDMTAYLFCKYKDGGDVDSLLMKLGKANFEGKNKQLALSEGWIGRYAVTIEPDVAALKKFKQDCKAKGAAEDEVYMGLAARFSGDETIAEQALRLSLTIMPITGFGSLFGINKLDEVTMIFNKTVCGKNLLKKDSTVNVPAYKGSFDDFDDAIEKLVTSRSMFWSVEDVITIIEKKQPLTCSVTMAGS